MDIGGGQSVQSGFTATEIHRVSAAMIMILSTKSRTPLDIGILIVIVIVIQVLELTVSRCRLLLLILLCPQSQLLSIDSIRGIAAELVLSPLL